MTSSLNPFEAFGFVTSPIAALPCIPPWKSAEIGLYPPNADIYSSKTVDWEVVTSRLWLRHQQNCFQTNNKALPNDIGVRDQAARLV